MRMSVMALTCTLAIVLVTAASPTWAQAQHEGHATPGLEAAMANPEQLAACVQGQPQILALIDAGDRRLELARQANDPAAMRAAVGDLQTTLATIRSGLAPCVALAAAMAIGQPEALRQAAPPPPPPTPPAQPTTQAPSSNLDITFKSTPAQPRGAAENEFEVVVKDRQGKTVDGVDVSLQFYTAAMPSMRMPEMRNEVKLKGTGNGKYTGKGQIMMAGPWTVTVSVKQKDKEIGAKKVEITAR